MGSRLPLVVGMGCAVAVVGVAAGQSGFAAQNPALPHVTQVDPAQLSAAVATSGTIAGTVTGSGRAVAGYRAEAFTTNGNFIADAVTDAAGRYSITGLQSGTYRVRFSGPNSGPAPWAMAWVGGAASMTASPVVTVGSTPITVDIRLTRAATVTGSVASTPAGSEVRVCGQSFLDCRVTTTAGNGRFTINGLAAGNGAIFVQPVGGEDLAFPAQPPRAPIPLRAGTTTSVTVDAATQAAPVVSVNGKTVKPSAAPPPPPDRSAPPPPVVTLTREFGKRLVHVQATDRQSGIKTVQIRVGDTQLSDAVYSTGPYPVSGKDPVSVRVQDKAGNYSAWVVAK